MKATAELLSVSDRHTAVIRYWVNHMFERIKWVNDSVTHLNHLLCFWMKSRLTVDEQTWSIKLADTYFDYHIIYNKKVISVKTH